MYRNLNPNEGKRPFGLPLPLIWIIIPVHVQGPLVLTRSWSVVVSLFVAFNCVVILDMKLDKKRKGEELFLLLPLLF